MIGQPLKLTFAVSLTALSFHPAKAQIPDESSRSDLAKVWEENQKKYSVSYEKIWEVYLDDRAAIDAAITNGPGNFEVIYYATQIAKAAIFLEVDEYREQVDRTAQLALTITDETRRNVLFSSLFDALLDVGAIEDAMKVNQIRAGKDGGSPASELAPLRNIAEKRAAEAVGDYEAEEAALHQSIKTLEILRRPGLSGLASSTLGSEIVRLAYVQAMQGKRDEAEATLEEALKFKPGTGAPALPPGIPKEMASEFLKATALQSDLVNFWTLRSYAETCLLLGRKEEALEFLEQGLALTDRAWIQQIEAYGEIFALAGRIHFENGKAQQSISNWEKALTEFLKPVPNKGFVRTEIHPEIVALREGLAWARLLAGDDSATSEVLAIQEAKQTIVERLFRFSGQRQRLSFLQTLDPYSLLVATGENEKLAESILRFKGSVLDSILEDRNLASKTSSPEFAELGRDLRVAKRMAFKAAWSNTPEAEALVTKVQTLEAKLGSAFGKSTGSRTALSVTTPSVQAVLNPEDRLCEYIQYQRLNPDGGTTPCYGAMIYSSDQSPAWIPLGEAGPINEAILSLKEAMSQQAEISEVNLSSLLKSLFSSLLDPLTEHVSENNRLIISPDSDLSCLSFAVLRDDQNRFAANRWKICYVSTGRDLLQPSQEPEGKLKLAVFANPDFSEKTPNDSPTQELRSILVPFSLDFSEIPPLPGTQAELNRIETIAGEFGWDVQAFDGNNAKESALSSLKEAPHILHFATHGLFLDRQGSVATASDLSYQTSGSITRFDNPLMRAILTLTGAQTTFQQWSKQVLPDPDSDGILTAEEISQLDLENTWLATLSACDTASGKTLEGEGVLGLRRGFFLAGVDHLVMTFWPISDHETVDFIDRFYRSLPEHRHPGLALSQVQSEALVRINAESGLRSAVTFAGPFAASVSGPLPSQ